VWVYFPSREVPRNIIVEKISKGSKNIQYIVFGTNYKHRKTSVFSLSNGYRSVYNFLAQVRETGSGTSNIVNTDHTKACINT
jgi:hypothetical protein